MSIDRTRRITFEEVADLYNETRPGYPEALIEDIVRLSDLPDSARILEIGCGPGNATLPFARRGYSVLAIELGERLAELARRNCRDFPAVEVICSAFEDANPPDHSFDLALSADAFHWVRPEIGYPKVCAALNDSGSIAFFWHVHVDAQADWSREIDRVYAERAPQADNPSGGVTLPWLTERIKANYRQYGCFGEISVRAYSWSERITADQFIKLLRTYSSHRGMDETMRQHLYAGIRAVIEKYGGEVEQPYQVGLLHARMKR